MPNWTMVQFFSLASFNRLWVIKLQICLGWPPAETARSKKMELFHTLKPIHISRNHFISDGVLNNHNYYWFMYWGDKVEVESSIEFKRSSKSARENH
ncbi:MAG: hypothetical protein JXB29_03915 [Sedimentisphaerales bacterium]|nr:hypothetical protein [Sedimentisphaerales bacterium]